MGKWQNRLVKKGMIDSPVVEITPFVFNDRLYRLDNWRGIWNHLDDDRKPHRFEDQVQIRDMQTEEIVLIPLVGYAFAIAYVWDGKVYVFAGKFTDDINWHIKSIWMTCSEDLKQWSEPVEVLRANEIEHFFNTGVCHDGEKFVLLVETDEPTWPKFTFKYYVSDDLINWRQVVGALYGTDKYVGGPAFYFANGYYYTLYLEDLGNGWETRITRSRDLINWEDAPDGRAVVKFDPENMCLPMRGEVLHENNASDLEVCYWQGKALAYFTGGDQFVCGYLQWAEFEGTTKEFLEHYFE